ncbi:hypothetical protein D1007_34946 [Hordeum vulgare]|nr:hypothetical protein D1007_34946 [Hordeum vulgare]
MSGSTALAYSGGGRIRRRGGPARSPVPYREQPMDYEPTKNCSLCGKKAPRWISWSPANPGRRYYSCVEAQCDLIGQHGFVEWHDGPTTPFLRDLLGDLRDKVWMLEEEATQLPTENDVAVLRKELEKKTVVISEIVARCEKKVESQMYKSMIYALILFLAGFVAGMILS